MVADDKHAQMMDSMSAHIQCGDSIFNEDKEYKSKTY